MFWENTMDLTGGKIRIWNSTLLLIVHEQENLFINKTLAKYNLPHSTVSANAAEELLQFDAQYDLKLAPYLCRSILTPNTFEKMNVSLAFNKGYDWRAEGDVHLELATKNEATRSLGVVYVDIVIGDITYPRTRFFVVPDLRDDVILGHEWLEAVKATLCYAQQCVAPPLIGRGPWRRCDSTWIAAPCPSYSQRVYSTSSPRLTTPASWTLYVSLCV
ncbi:hypothetical protein GEV33_006787 [Tenebrio molitor]|uniref:Uncharacterized protein n=1 Tax=Tenebrio molitor TaxID=7067 RepID=A0A8J6HJY4_TENMO|nr:hypothetical protein GEV33_006787 [Tenebrio molitor]